MHQGTLNPNTETLGASSLTRGAQHFGRANTPVPARSRKSRTCRRLPSDSGSGGFRVSVEGSGCDFT